MARKETEYYLNNKNLKKEGVKIEFTPEQLEEYVKCSKDMMYFARNYMKIISLDRGEILFEPYNYQEKLIKTCQENRFVICKLPRQSGKCSSKNTNITIKNKITGEIKKITINELFKSLKDQEKMVVDVE